MRVQLAELRKSCTGYELDESVSMLKELVPDYMPSASLSRRVAADGPHEALRALGVGWGERRSVLIFRKSEQQPRHTELKPDTNFPLKSRLRRIVHRLVAADALAFAHSLASGGSWTLLGTVLSQFCALLGTIAAARILGRNAFGELMIVQSTTYMLAGVGSAGIGVTSTRYLSQLKDSDPARAGRVLGLSASVSAATAIAFAVILLFLAPVLAAKSFNAPELSGFLRLSSVAVLFVSMNAFQTGSLIGLHAFRTNAIINAIQGGVSLLTILLLVPHFALHGAIVALIVTSASVWFWSQKLLRAECRKFGIQITHRNIWREKAIFLDFALPSALSGISGQMAVWGSNAIVARQANGMVELGLFSVANTFRQVVLFAPGVLSRVAMPLLANRIGKTASRSYRPSFDLNVRINALLGSGTAVLVALAVPVVLPVYGRGFGAGLATTYVLLASAPLEVISWAFFQALVGHGRIWVSMPG